MKNKHATTNGFKIIYGVLLALIIIGFAIFYLNRFFFSQTPYSTAVHLMKTGKAAAAVPILEDLSVRHPENASIFPWLALGYLNCDRIAEGRIALDTALRMGLSPSEVAEAVKTYTDFYEHREDFQEAEKLLASASLNCPTLRLNESKAKLYFNWGEYELNNNNLLEAASHLEKAYSFNSFVREPLGTNITQHLAETYKRLSAEAEDNQSDTKAIFYLEKSLNIVDDPSTRMYLAQLYAENNQSQKAIDNYQSVADADPNNLEARHRLIDLLIQVGNYQQAQEALVDLINKEKSVETYEQLVEVALRLKNYARAVHALEDACELSMQADLLKQLLTVLDDWETSLIHAQKLEEAASVKGHAERVAEQLNEVLAEEEKNTDEMLNKDNQFASAKDLPVALISSHIWLSAGSLTPEGEIKIKNITGKPVRDLTLKAIFYDHNLGRDCGTVTLPVVTPMSIPFSAGSSRTLYFSCPNTIRSEHHLGVKLYWHGNFLKEFPVAKQS